MRSCVPRWVLLGMSSASLNLRAVLTSCSDLAEAFPTGEFSALYRQDWLTSMIKETRSNREFQARTIDTARWAREQVKRQIGGSQGIQQT
jgi:importin subunit beta-1